MVSILRPPPIYLTASHQSSPNFTEEIVSRLTDMATDSPVHLSTSEGLSKDLALDDKGSILGELHSVLCRVIGSILDESGSQADSLYLKLCDVILVVGAWNSLALDLSSDGKTPSQLPERHRPCDTCNGSSGTRALTMSRIDAKSAFFPLCGFASKSPLKRGCGYGRVVQKSCTKQKQQTKSFDTEALAASRVRGRGLDPSV